MLYLTVSLQSGLLCFWISERDCFRGEIEDFSILEKFLFKAYFTVHFKAAVATQILKHKPETSPTNVMN